MAKVSIEKLTLDPAERRARLGTPTDTPLRGESELDGLLRESISCDYLIRRLPVFSTADGVTFGGVSAVSSALGRVVGDAEAVYILVATLGFGADRRIAQAMAESTSAGFVTDALADCYIEALADYVTDRVIPGELFSGEELGRRFSPGYADLALSLNGDIISLVGASAKLGIRLTESGFMTPKKSITAIIPIY